MGIWVPSFSRHWPSGSDPDNNPLVAGCHLNGGGNCLVTQAIGGAPTINQGAAELRFLAWTLCVNCLLTAGLHWSPNSLPCQFKILLREHNESSWESWHQLCDANAMALDDTLDVFLVSNLFDMFHETGLEPATSGVHQPAISSSSIDNVQSESLLL